MRLDINYKKKKQQKTNSWKINSMLLKNQWIIEEIKEEIKRFLETNDNNYTIIQNPCNIAKAVLRGKFRTIQISQERRKAQINNLTLQIKHLEKEEQTKPKVSRRKKNHKDQGRNK